MATTGLTKDTGATIKPGPMVVAGADQVMTDDVLDRVAAGTGLNGPFVADFLASAATQENDGINLFRALAVMSANPVLQARYTVQQKMVLTQANSRLAQKAGAAMEGVIGKLKEVLH